MSCPDAFNDIKDILKGIESMPPMLGSFSHSLSQSLKRFAFGEVKFLPLNLCKFGGSAQGLRIGITLKH